MVRTVDIVWAYLLQIILFAELPTVWSAVGACLIAVSVTIIGLKKLLEVQRQKRPVLSITIVRVVPVVAPLSGRIN